MSKNKIIVAGSQYHMVKQPRHGNEITNCKTNQTPKMRNSTFPQFIQMIPKVISAIVSLFSRSSYHLVGFSTSSFALLISSFLVDSFFETLYAFAQSLINSGIFFSPKNNKISSAKIKTPIHWE